MELEMSTPWHSAKCSRSALVKRPLRSQSPEPSVWQAEHPVLPLFPSTVKSLESRYKKIPQCSTARNVLWGPPGSPIADQASPIPPSHGDAALYRPFEFCGRKSGVCRLLGSSSVFIPETLRCKYNGSHFIPRYRVHI